MCPQDHKFPTTLQSKVYAKQDNNLAHFKSEFFQTICKPHTKREIDLSKAVDYCADIT